MFSPCHERGTKKISTHEELNYRPSDSALRCHRDSTVSKAHYEVHILHAYCILLE